MYFSCGRVVEDNSVLCFGANGNGQFGDQTTVSTTAASVFGEGVSGVSEVYAGGATVCVTFPTGEMQCTGDNTGGVLGDGTFTHSAALVDVLNMPPA
jgi:hypothetical protein